MKALGVPALPIQILPHPIGQLQNEQMRVLADQAYDEVIFGLTATVQEVAKAYDTAAEPRSAYSL